MKNNKITKHSQDKMVEVVTGKSNGQAHYLRQMCYNNIAIYRQKH